MRIQNHFHINGFPRSLSLEERLAATRKWLGGGIYRNGEFENLRNYARDTGFKIGDRDFKT